MDAANLSYNLDALGLPQDARDWLMDVWHVTQVLDDAMDGDKADPAQVSLATWAVFARMPANPFYQQYLGALTAVLVLQIRKWEAANAVESAQTHSEKTYMWRAGFFDLVEMVCHLCGLQNTGANVMQLYGETYAEYLEGK